MFIMKNIYEIDNLAIIFFIQKKLKNLYHFFALRPLLEGCGLESLS
jgi:hypothetical protein